MEFVTGTKYRQAFFKEIIIKTITFSDFGDDISLISEVLQKACLCFQNYFTIKNPLKIFNVTMMRWVYRKCSLTRIQAKKSLKFFFLQEKIY